MSEHATDPQEVRCMACGETQGFAGWNVTCEHCGGSEWEEPESESTALVVVYPRGETPYQDFASEVVSLVDTANQLVVNNPADSKVATDHLGAIADRSRAIEAFRRELLAPVKQRTNDINEAVKEGLYNPLASADKYLRGLILRYNEEVRAETARLEEIERRKQELAALEDKPAPEPTPPPEQRPSVTRGATTQSSERMVTRYEVEDFGKLSDDYKVVDTGKLTRAVKAGGTSLTIPGVRIFQEPVLAIGRG